MGLKASKQKNGDETTETEFIQDCFKLGAYAAASKYNENMANTTDFKVIRDYKEAKVETAMFSDVLGIKFISGDKAILVEMKCVSNYRVGYEGGEYGNYTKDSILGIVKKYNAIV